MESHNIDTRKPRSISMSEREKSFAENIMYYYRLHSISDAIRFLIIRENAAIEAEAAKGNEVK